MIKDILKELSEISSAPGADSALLSHIEKKYGKYCDSVQYDGIGNLIFTKKGNGKKNTSLLLASDSAGLGAVVNYIEENGYLRITKLGNADTAGAAYSEIVFENGTHGFVYPDSGAEVKDGDFSKLYVDIGAKSRDEAEKYVKLGDTCAFVSKYTHLCSERAGLSGSPASVGMAILLEALIKLSESTVERDICFAFNIQDAPRNLSAKTSAFTAECDEFILVGNCESYDTPGSTRRGEAVLGDGAVIIAKSADHCANPEMREKLEGICEKENIKHKTCVYADMTTQAGIIAKSGKGVSGLALCVPARGIKSAQQIIELSDAESAVNLILAYAGR